MPKKRQQKKGGAQGKRGKGKGGGGPAGAVDLAGAKAANDVWTVTLGGGLGFGGRVPANERFVVEAWPHSADCPLPGGNDDNAQELLSYGIDSVYYSGGYDKTCGGSLVDVINKLGADAGTVSAALAPANTNVTAAATGMHVVTDADTAADRARSISVL